MKQISLATSVAIMGLSLVGCELIAFKQSAKLPLDPVKKEQQDEVFHQLENKAPVLEGSKEIYSGTDKYV